MKFKLAARAYTIADARVCRRHGFDRLEITLPFSGGPSETLEWKKLKNEYKLKFLAHGPNEGNPTDIDHLRSSYLPIIKKAIESASDLEADLLTIHMWVDGRMIPSDKITEKITLLQEAAGYGAEKGVTVCIENLSEDHQQLAPVFAKSNEIGFTLDVGHAQLTRPESTALDLIEHHFDRLLHIHLHDNLGGFRPSDDLHMPPGEGIVPFGAVLGLLKAKGYSQTATLELKPDQLPAAKKYIMDQWDRN